MPEEIVINYLGGILGVPVQFELDPEAEETVVTVRSSGMERENLIDTATMVLSSYGATPLAAARLNRKVQAAMDKLAEIDAVSGSHLVTAYPAPDTQNRRHRWQCVYNITFYEQ